MGWKNYIPIFSTATETVVYLANKDLRCNHLFSKHKLEDHVELVVIPESPPLQAPMSGLIRNTYLIQINANLTAYVDVNINGFLGLSQGPANRRRHVSSSLFHALDKVIQPLEPADTANQE